jgi:hypothetical protein
MGSHGSHAVTIVYNIYRLPGKVVCIACLKVHKHEIFSILFLQEPNPCGPQGQ